MGLVSGIGACIALWDPSYLLNLELSSLKWAFQWSTGDS